LLSGIVSKIVTGVLILTVVAAGISWWQMDLTSRQAILSAIGRLGAWVAIVLLLPWATFFATGWVARMDSNLAGALLVGTYTILEAAWLGWMHGWSGYGPVGWTMFAAAVLFAAVYNLLVCDWIAEKLLS
jgi:hypothetical protein